MKTIHTGGLIISFVFVMILTPVRAQQNFINVPSSEVTGKGKIFYQQQFNFNEMLQANSTFDYGLGHGFEAGLNVLGLNYNDRGRKFFNNDTNDRYPYNPLVTINALKQFRLSGNSSLTFGGQCGINVDFDRRTKEASLFYANYALKDVLGKDSRLVIGSYYNSMHYGGNGNRIGLWAGAQVPVTEKFHVMGETVLGSNAMAYSTFAVMYYPKKWLPLTLGIQVPNSKQNSYSMVLEITFVPR